MSNKNTTIILTIILILAIVGGVAIFYITNNNTQTQPTPPSNNQTNNENNNEENNVVDGILEKFENDSVHIRKNNEEVVQINTNKATEYSEIKINEDYVITEETPLNKDNFQKEDRVSAIWEEQNGKKTVVKLRKFDEESFPVTSTEE